MIKTIYDDKNKFYRHEYFCDKCFEEIKYGEIFRKEIFIYEIDLCCECYKNYEIKRKVNNV